MITDMKRRLITWIFVAGCVLLSPNVTRAADEPPVAYDARAEGYYNGPGVAAPGQLTVQSTGTALVWIIMLVLTGAAVGVMFKNSGRTHLD